MGVLGLNADEAGRGWDKGKGCEGEKRERVRDKMDREESASLSLPPNKTANYTKCSTATKASSASPESATSA